VTQFSTLARVLPFAAFIALMILEEAFAWLAPDLAKSLQPWMYPFRVIITAAVLIWLWVVVRKESYTWHAPSASSLVLAVVAGVCIIFFWIVIGPMFRASTPTGINPIPEDPIAAGLWLIMRFLGAVVLVPVIEELFWRSFLARRVDVDDVTELRPENISWKAIAITSLVFGFGHSEVVAGAISGIVFCWLYKRNGNLLEPIIAHSVANLLLFVYVVKYSAFEFWG
jgi:uncharacterized protein